MPRWAASSATVAPFWRSSSKEWCDSPGAPAGLCLRSTPYSLTVTFISDFTDHHYRNSSIRLLDLGKVGEKQFNETNNHETARLLTIQDYIVRSPSQQFLLIAIEYRPDALIDASSGDGFQHSNRITFYSFGQFLGRHGFVRIGQQDIENCIHQ